MSAQPIRVRQRFTGELGTVLGTAERAALVLVRWDRGMPALSAGKRWSFSRSSSQS